MPQTPIHNVFHGDFFSHEMPHAYTHAARETDSDRIRFNPFLRTDKALQGIHLLSKRQAALVFKARTTSRKLIGKETPLFRFFGRRGAMRTLWRPVPTYSS